MEVVREEAAHIDMDMHALRMMEGSGGPWLSHLDLEGIPQCGADATPNSDMEALFVKMEVRVWAG